MNTRVVIAPARCATDYVALLSALAHARACVLCEYRARSRAYDKCKLLDDKVEEADTVSKQLAAVSAMCDAHSVRVSALLHSAGHINMFAQSLKNAKLDMTLHAPATQGRQREADDVMRALPPIKIS